MESGDSWKINGSNKINFLGKLCSSLKVAEDKHKIKKNKFKSNENEQEKSGKGINKNSK